MLSKARQFAVRLHEDETGPNTVEWVLLIIVGLIVLVAIFVLAEFIIDKMKEKKADVETDPFLTTSQR